MPLNTVHAIGYLLTLLRIGWSLGGGWLCCRYAEWMQFAYIHPSMEWAYGYVRKQWNEAHCWVGCEETHKNKTETGED